MQSYFRQHLMATFKVSLLRETLWLTSIKFAEEIQVLT